MLMVPIESRTATAVVVELQGMLMGISDCDSCGRCWGILSGSEWGWEKGRS